MWDIVALLTDYGYVDTYVAEVKARILSYRRDVSIIDVTHGVSSFSELEATFLLRNAARSFPDETMFICIVDPKVGTERRAIIFFTRRGRVFIGPDTGVMVPAAEESGGIDSAWVVDESKLPRRFSETFHGRDVFAEVAGRLLAGKKVEEIADRVEGYVTLTLPEPIIKGRSIIAQVMHVDKFGNVITNIPYTMIGGDTRYVKLSIARGRRIRVLRVQFVKSYGHVAKGRPLVTIGGSGYLELSINMGNAAKRYGIRVGDRIKVTI